MANISVIILTFNEELNIKNAIKSVLDWADEIFVLDSFSTDNTASEVASFDSPKVFFYQHAFEDFSKQWNWALKNLPVKSDWTLKLDADERVTKEFIAECSVLFDDDGISGIYFRRKMFFMGEPLWYGGFSSTYVLHLWRTGAGAFEDRSVNEHLLVDGPTIKVSSFIEHYDFKSLSDWIEKHNRYSSMEASASLENNVCGDIQPKFFGNEDERRIFFKNIYWKTPFKNLIYFVYKYVFKKAFLNGKVGFVYCLLHAVYRYWIGLKIEEYNKTGKWPTISWPRRGSRDTGN